MGPKVGFWVQKWVKSWAKPAFHPLQTHFGIFAKTHFSASLSQRRRNDNINKICVLEGVGEGEIYGKLSKNAVSPGIFHDNKIWKFCEFYCQKFCCHLGGSYQGGGGWNLFSKKSPEAVPTQHHSNRAGACRVVPFIASPS